MNDLLLRACRREAVERPPVWIMRQAGRYLPEYRALRAQADFLTLVTDPELATEATLLPVDRLGVDAAIIFSDILVIPRAMGMELRVEEGVGPWFPTPLRSPADVARLRDPAPEADLAFVLQAIGLTKRALDGRVPLIGFAGGPWTLASYMVEGRGAKQFSQAKRFLVESPALAHALLARLANAVGRFLQAQVRAGAQVVQIFESSAGVLAPVDFREFVLPFLVESPALAHALLARLANAVGRFLQAQVRAGAQVVQIFESSAGAVAPVDFREFVLPYLVMAVRLAREAGAPVIAFAPGAGWALEQIARETGAEVVGIDWQTDGGEARRRLAPIGVAAQGNFDPCWLYASPEIIQARTRAMLDAFDGPGYIVNLGHGILPDTPVEHARAFVEAVKGYAAPNSSAGEGV